MSSIQKNRWYDRIVADPGVLIGFGSHFFKMRSDLDSYLDRGIYFAEYYGGGGRMTNRKNNWV